MIYLENFQYCIKLKGKIFYYFNKVFIVDQTVIHVWMNFGL